MTIFALSTGPGISGVAIIRISGEQSSKIIETLTGKKTSSAKSSNIKKNQ
jgi:tRNA modification GTPase